MANTKKLPEAKKGTAKPKVKKDKLVAKLICGALIPSVLTVGIIGGAYHYYWYDQSFYCGMWKNGNQFEWQGNVNKLSEFIFEINIDAASTGIKFNKFYLTTDQGTNYVPIRKLIDVSMFIGGAEQSITWHIDSKGYLVADSGQEISYSDVDFTANIRIRTSYKGHIKAYLVHE